MRSSQRACKALRRMSSKKKSCFKFTCWETTINCIMEVDERVRQSRRREEGKNKVYNSQSQLNNKSEVDAIKMSQSSSRVLKSGLRFTDLLSRVSLSRLLS